MVADGLIQAKGIEIKKVSGLNGDTRRRRRIACIPPNLGLTTANPKEPDNKS
jgi:hypothetical protein